MGRKVRYRGAFRNSLFSVQVFHRDVVLVRDCGPRGLEELKWRTPHLAIRRHDGTEILGWDILQRIKNEIVGRDRIAVEVFPAADDLVNEANMRHLFVWDSCPFTIKGPWT